ncbi:MAG: FAD-dependent oxidoreductase [Kiloniellales bacterium]
MQRELPAQAEIVIIGGGVIGCSIAYHLAAQGRRDVVLLEKHKLTSGTTWHAAGLVMQLRANRVMTELSRYAVKLYSELEALGHPTGLSLCGSLPVARNQERLHEIRRLITLGRRFGIDIEEVSPSEIVDLHPLIDASRVVGGAFVPGDGQTNPVDTTMALAAAAKAKGVKILEGVSVDGFRFDRGRLSAVRSGAQEIACEVAVIAAGLWSPQVGALAGIKVPLHACEHMYVVTEPLAGVTKGLPVIRDTDGTVYIKEDAGKLLVGSFEPRGKPLPLSRLPEETAFIQLSEDWDHFWPPFQEAMTLVPALANAPIGTFLNGPESFTPDTRFILGPAPEREGLFVATGFNSQGVLSAAGAGKVLAEWIVSGEAPIDLAALDIRRFQAFQSNARYLAERASEALGYHYSMHWPQRQFETGRPARVTPLYLRLKEHNACFGEAAGWERANWYAPEGESPQYKHSYDYRGANWFEAVGEEHRATRSAVGLFDMSSFGKFFVQGADAASALQRICANDVEVPVGRIVYTQCLNTRGGIEADVTITRLAEDRFLVVTAAASQARDLAWFQKCTPRDARVAHFDATSAYGVLAVMGPQSRALLQDLTTADLGNEAFPFASCQEIDLGYAKVLALRVTYVGELGWELYVPSEFLLPLFDLLVAEGRPQGLRLAGYHALDSLRIEKGYRHWGHDITPDDTPLEAGLGFAVKLASNIDFIGREALSKQRQEGIRRRALHFMLEADDGTLLHDEAIVVDGRYVGEISSGAYGYSLQRPLGIGYVDCPDGDWKSLAERPYEIEIGTRRYPARASTRPFYDPTSARVRS